MRIFAFGFVTFLVTHITAQVHGVPKTPLPPKSTTMLVPMSESETKTTPTVETKATLNVDPKASLETSTQAEPKTEHKPQLKSVFTHRSELALTLNLDRKRELRKPTPYQPLFHSISTVEQQCRKACIDGFDFCLKRKRIPVGRRERWLECKLEVCTWEDTCPGCNFCRPEYHL